MEINQDLRLQAKVWRFQKISWALMTLFVIAALSGVLGPGPLSKKTQGDETTPIQAEYERFAQSHSPTQLRVSVAPGTARDGQVRLAFNREFIEAMRIRQITPEPARSETSDGRLIFIFNVTRPESAASISFELEPNAAGVHQARIGLGDQEVLTFSQVVYP